MTAILCLIPLLMIININEQVAYIYGSMFNWWPIVILALLEAVGLIWLGRVISFKEVAGGASWALAGLFPFILYFCVEWLCFGDLSETLRFFFGNHFYMMLFMVALLTAIF